MRKPASCICENKGADQLPGNHTADQQIAQSLYFLNLKFQTLAIFCGCAARFASDLVRNPEKRFSHEAPAYMPPQSIAGCLMYSRMSKSIQQMSIIRMSLVMRKPRSFRFLTRSNRGILSRQQKTKMLISLRGTQLICASMQKAGFPATRFFCFSESLLTCSGPKSRKLAQY